MAATAGAHLVELYKFVKFDLLPNVTIILFFNSWQSMNYVISSLYKPINFTAMKNLKDVMDELFMVYVRTEEFACFNEAERNKFCDQVEELKALASEK